MIDRRVCVALAVLLWSEAGRAQDGEFPIGAWFPGLFHAHSADWGDRLDLVVADHFNTIHASDTGRPGMSGQPAADNNDWMLLAVARDLNIQLHSVWQPPQWKNHSRHYWARTFQAEDGALFTHPIGERVTETDGRVAWYADAGRHTPGLLLDTPSTSGSGFELRSNVRAQTEGRHLDERHTRHVFWLKTDNTTGADILATLRVLRHSDGTVLNSSIVRPFRFAAANVYQGFAVRYDIPRGDERVRYQVDWTGAGDLWVDLVRASDFRGMQLFRGDYNMDIVAALEAYDGTIAPVPWRFYAYDEPRWDTPECVGYMNDLIKDEHGRQSGAAAVNQTDLGYLRRYIREVQPSELLVDYYAYSPAPRTDRTSRELRWIRQGFGNALTASREAGIPWWACVQAFGNHNHGGGFRVPTAPEIAVQVNLALAHGARGIYYFMMSSHTDPNTATEQEGLYSGTWGTTTNSNAVRALNHKLRALAPTYLALTSNHVFADNALADFVQGISATTGGTDDYFLGTFTHTDGSRYLMVVNEDLTTTPDRRLTVTLNATRLPGSGPYRLLDVYRNTPISAGGRNPNRPQFSVTLGPGAGTLYRVEKVPVPPPPPNLTATPGHRKLTLSWETPANNGSALRRFQYRRSVDGGRTWAPDWSRDTIIPRSGPATTSHVFGGLTNGTAYTFEIRARSGAGDGEAAQVTATPLGPPANLRAEAGDEQVTLRWDDPSPANPTIAKWQYCLKPAGAASCEADAWQSVESASTRQAVVSKLKHNQTYQFEVRAVNTADQAGPAAP